MMRTCRPASDRASGAGRALHDAADAAVSSGGSPGRGQIPTRRRACSAGSRGCAPDSVPWPADLGARITYLLPPVGGAKASQDRHFPRLKRSSHGQEIAALDDFAAAAIDQPAADLRLKRLEKQDVRLVHSLDSLTRSMVESRDVGRLLGRVESR